MTVIKETGFIDPDVLRQWLESKDPREAVGIAEDQQFCPVAVFLGQTVGAKSIVTPKSLSMEGVPGTWVHQDWLRTFVLRIDVWLEGTVEALDALTVLDSVKIHQVEGAVG